MMTFGGHIIFYNSDSCVISRGNKPLNEHVRLETCYIIYTTTTIMYMYLKCLEMWMPLVSKTLPLVPASSPIPRSRQGLVHIVHACMKFADVDDCYHTVRWEGTCSIANICN